MHSKQASLAHKILQLFVQALGVDGGVIAQKSNSAPILIASLETSDERAKIFLDNSHLLESYTDYSQLLDKSLIISEHVKDQTQDSLLAFRWTAPDDNEMLVFLHYSNKRFSNADKLTLQTIIDFWDQTSLALKALEQRNTLFDLEQSSLLLPENAQLQEILKAVINAVPQSSTAHLLLHKGRHFQIWATSSDVRQFQQLRFKTADIKRWFYEAFDPDNIQAQCFTTHEVQQHPLLSQLHVAKPHTDTIGSLYLPIKLRDELVAILNLDSSQTTFSNYAQKTVQFFAPSVALAAREHQNKQLIESTSLIDPLTSLENHKAFQQALQRESSRAQRYNNPFSLLILDLRDFAKLNASLGNLECDDILIEAAKALSRIVRTSDVAFRWGGDEFAVILPNTAYQGAIVAARRFARAIKQIPSSIPIKLNIGVATYPQCAATATELEEVVIKRLNEGKNKNITVLLAESALESAKVINS